MSRLFTFCMSAGTAVLLLAALTALSGCWLSDISLPTFK